MTTKTEKKTGSNGAGTDEKPKSVQELLKSEVDARKAWYAHFGGGAPQKPYTKEASASLRALEKAKSALIAATGTGNFKEAATKLKYSPQYAPRSRQPVKAEAKK